MLEDINFWLILSVFCLPGCAVPQTLGPSQPWGSCLCPPSGGRGAMPAGRYRTSFAAAFSIQEPLSPPRWLVLWPQTFLGGIEVVAPPLLAQPYGFDLRSRTDLPGRASHLIVLRGLFAQTREPALPPSMASLPSTFRRCLTASGL